MPSKQPDVDRPQISPVLFLTVDGEPMTFYLRPGPAKCELQPLIKAGGGVLSGVQKPGAILLTDPEERGAIPAQSAHWYVSTQYIRDCVEKDEQLELEDYRLNPETVQSGSPKPTQSKAPSAALTTGRSPYTPEEDAAILKYVSKHKDEVGGNRLWQQMETWRVTTHSWQSMKARYRSHLAQRLAVTAGDAAEEEEDKDGNTDQETAEQKPGEEAAAEPESADHPPTDSSETQVDITAEPYAPNMNTPAKSMKLEIRPVSISSSSKGDGTSLIPPTDEQQPSENPRAGTAEAGARGSPPPPADGLARSTDPEEESPSEPLFSSPARKKSKQRDADTPTEIRTRRRSLRRQPELKLDEPYGKKLRSSLPFVEKPTVTTRRSNLPRKSAHQKDTAVDEQPARRARGRSAAPESAQLESQQLESAQLESSQLESSQLETPQLESQQMESSQLETPQLESQQMESSQLEIPQLEIPQLESQQMESSQLETPQLESQQLESQQMETPQLETPQLESQQMDSSQLESQQLDSSQLESQQLESSQLESSQLEAPQLEAPQLESQQMESQQMESSHLESSHLESQQLETPQLESQQLETPHLESQQLETPQLESQQLETPHLESQQLESQQLETPQLESQQLEAEGGDDPEPAGKVAKKTEKRKLGIFELATKEFDDDSEDEGQSLQTGAAPAETQPASSEEELPQCSSAALTQKDPEPEPQPGPSLQQQQQQQQVPEARTPRGPRPPCRTGDVSEEEESQSIISARPSEKSQPAANEGQELLPTQIQLEEDKQRITELMNRSKQDLDSVVKALLKTSGDFAAALDLLLDPSSSSSSSSSGPIWSLRDDELLMSGDRNVHQQLLKEFGEEGVAKRRRFLDGGSV